MSDDHSGDKRVSVGVSVVIPCYRCEGTIERAVLSVLKQTTMPLEIILVNDASPDQTLNVLHEVRSKYKDAYSCVTIEIINLPQNGGPSRARNVGWDSAVGEVVAFLDSDDSWHPQKLEIQYGYMALNQDVNLVCHSSDLFDSEISAKTYSAIDAIQFSYVSKKSLLFKNKIHTRTVMVRSQVCQRFPLSMRYSEDYHLWLAMAYEEQKIIYVDAILAFTYKPQYGASGLSANLWAMEMGELSNFRMLRERRLIGLLDYVFATAFSLIKFLRRCFISYAKS